jgi:hypothetical protein
MSTSSQSITKGIYILSGMVNPKEKKEELNLTLKAGEIKTITLGTKFTLTNSGGNVLLLSSDKVTAHQLEYTNKDVIKKGWTVKF